MDWPEGVSPTAHTPQKSVFPERLIRVGWGGGVPKPIILRTGQDLAAPPGQTSRRQKLPPEQERGSPNKEIALTKAPLNRRKKSG